MAQKPNPIALAMVVCDTVIDDRKTGKKSVIGMFNNITVSKVPALHPRLNIFISMTEGNGDYTCKLQCIYVDENSPVAELGGPIVFKNPQQIIEFNFELCGLPLPKYGTYRFDFYCNDIIVISRKFTVLPPKQSQ